MCVCVCVCLTVSLSSPNSSALWPNRTSAVSWKHVTHWLSPKSAKLAWESDRQGCRGWVMRLCMYESVRDDIPQLHLHQTSLNDVHCMRLQRAGVCIWSLGTLCYTSRSGTVRCSGRSLSCCSLQMDRPGTDSSPSECRPLSLRSWNTPPEKREGNGRSEKHQITWKKGQFEQLFQFSFVFISTFTFTYWQDRIEIWQEIGWGRGDGLEPWAAGPRTATWWWISSTCKKRRYIFQVSGAFFEYVNNAYRNRPPQLRFSCSVCCHGRTVNSSRHCGRVSCTKDITRVFDINRFFDVGKNH